MSLASAFIVLTPINYFTFRWVSGFAFRGVIFFSDFRSFLYRACILIIFSGIKIFWSYGFIQCYIFCAYVWNVMGCSTLGRGCYMANRHRLCCNTRSEHCNFSGGKSSMKIVLIRHGQTDWNKKKIQGHTNTALDSDGLRESVAISETLVRDDVELIFSSPLKRAYSTIEPLAR